MVIIFSILLFCFEVNGLDIITSQSRLHNDLFPNGSKFLSFPFVNKKINVTIGLTLRQIVDVEEINEAIVINAWLRQKWENDVISWNHTHYENIKSINIEPHMLWTPDLYIYANIEDDKSYNGLLDTVKNSINVNYNGSHSWKAPIIFRIGCAINVKNYPFDTQECDLRFGSSTYDGTRLELIPEDATADMKMYSENAEWVFISMKCVQRLTKYNRNKEPYYDVIYHLIIKRKPLFILVNLMLPNVMLSFLTAAVFILPVTSGERSGFVVGLLLAMALFLTSAINLIPDSSEVIPLLTYFLGTTLSAMFILTICLCYTVSIHHGKGRISPWMRYYILERLTPYMGIDFPQRYRKLAANRERKDVKRSRVFNSRLPQNHPGKLWSTPEKKILNIVEKLYAEKEFVGKSKEKMSKVLSQIISNIEDNEEERNLQREWEIAALTLDKLFLYTFSSIYAIILFSFAIRVLQL